MIIDDFRYMIKQHKLLMLGLFFCQIFFTVIIIFVISIFLNNRYEQLAQYSLQKSIKISVGNEYRKTQFVNTEKLKENFMKIFSEDEFIISSVHVQSEGICDGEKMRIQSSFEIQDGEYIPRGEHLKKIMIGEFFSKEDLNRKDKICILSKRYAENHKDFVLINNEQYKVIGYQYKESGSETLTNWQDTCFIPFMSLGDALLIYEIDVNLKRPLLYDEYKRLENSIKLYWGDKVHLSKYEKESIGEDSIKATINFEGAIMAILVAITMCSFIFCIIVKNQKKNAIFIINGCSNKRIMGNQIAEIIILTVINTLLGYWLYCKFVVDKFKNSYLWFSVICGSKECVFLLMEYVALVLLVSIAYVVSIMRKQPVNVLKKTL